MVSEFPVVVVGAGPQGLAAAAHLRERGLSPLVLESGPVPAHAVSQWAHVRLFSGWNELVDPAAARLLEPTGWIAPTEGYPTGGEWIASYLGPLAAALGDQVRTGARVTGVSRKGRDRLVDAGRDEQPFTVHVTYADGTEEKIDARAVIDASGTWTSPNPVGADGLPALGERAAVAAGLVTYLPPTPEQVEEFAGKHVAIVGAGHSAMTAVIQLGALAEAHPGTRVSWIVRRGSTGIAFGGGAADELPQRGALGLGARAAVDQGHVELVTGFRTDRITVSAGRAVLTGENGVDLAPADHVVVLTGFRPDLAFLGEMRLELDATLQAPVRIAAEVDPNLHSCGDVRATGAADLAHPEKDLYLVGMKSYGRAPTFLAMTGYEQVRSVAAALAGDHEAAARVELVLPDTGVCGGSGAFDDPAASSGGCCGAPASPELVELTVGAR
ncbi:NAD(P)-binding domain-containing protein [Cryptosporangium minutisporangium]|uniref:NAD(P)-binding domain-containing protein n=1 Tax=Cryptosporangium minutisporangium TaxID=113569 RepID=A0ABP6SR22_9ACTN